MRTKTTSRNPRTEPQERIRATWQAVSRRWLELPQTDRDQWAVIAPPGTSAFDTYKSWSTWLSMVQNAYPNPFLPPDPQVIDSISNPIFLNSGTSDYDIFQVDYLPGSPLPDGLLVLQIKPMTPLSHSRFPTQWVTMFRFTGDTENVAGKIQWSFRSSIENFGYPITIIPPSSLAKSQMRVVSVDPSLGTPAFTNQVDWTNAL